MKDVFLRQFTKRLIPKDAYSISTCFSLKLLTHEQLLANLHVFNHVICLVEFPKHSIVLPLHFHVTFIRQICNRWMGIGWAVVDQVIFWVKVNMW